MGRKSGVQHKAQNSKGKKNKPKARNFTGCWACRFKKRRCDEGKPFCSLCVRHGDSCSYDVQLIWLPMNMLYISLADGRLKGGKRDGCSTGITKCRFREITHFRGGEHYSEDSILSQRQTSGVSDNSFTISVRRLRVYDNALESIHGTPRRYDPRYVEQQLERSLKKLEGKLAAWADPFGVFACNTKPASSTMLQMEQERKTIVEYFFKKHWNVLVSRCGNAVLCNLEYGTWLREHIRGVALASRAFPYMLLQDIMKGGVNLLEWLQYVENASQEVKSICYMLLTLVIEAPELTCKIRHWLEDSYTIPFSAYPLILERQLSLLCDDSWETAMERVLRCEALLERVIGKSTCQKKITAVVHSEICRSMVAFNAQRLYQDCSKTSNDACIEIQLRYWETRLECIEQHYYEVYKIAPKTPEKSQIAV